MGDLAGVIIRDCVQKRQVFKNEVGGTSKGR